MRTRSTALQLVLSAFLGLTAFGALAAPDEIQVYTEELDDPGEFGLELHINHVPKGRRDPSFRGEMRSDHRLQVTPEFSYGVTKTIEAGLYLPIALASNGDLVGNGMRFRLKYIAQRDEAAKFFWGLNVELGYFARRVSESRIGMELRPIVGYRDDNWLVSFNPIIDGDLSSNVSRVPNFEPALKVAREVAEGTQAGLEYYGEYGPVKHLLPSSERAHYLYAVMDTDVKGLDLNFGIGRGFTNAEDRWVVKAIVAFPFK
jgi:hypothetical protein